MKNVNSGAIHSIGYDPETQTLKVRWTSGGTYEYGEVSPEKHRALMNAPSIGKHFHAQIKPHHEGTKV